MANPNDTLGRETLPIPDIRYGGTVTYNAKSPDTKYPPIVPLRPPSGAPNVLVILIDDTGFGATSAFGGPVNTPTFERLAAGGLKYTRFHTTALCSPTRAALLSGRNHHTVGMGGITEIATSAPGYNSIRPNTCAPIAETLKLNGYNTAQFGKCHEVPVWEASAMGPFDHWPHPGGGFEYFYGFLGGETNQYYPALIENTTPIEQPKTPEEGYTFNEDMADRTIGWIKSQKALVPDKPFFIYYAPGATHAPHHVPAEWADKYKGKFAQGWDKVREETFARQKELGVIPQNAELTVRSEGIPAWDEMSDKIKPVLEREMEVYAGFLEQTDHHIGRVIDAIESLGILEDTLIITIIGDNGASAEGSMIGTTNEGFTINHLNQLEDEDYLVAHKDDLGTVNSYNHYAIGWAHCMDTPYQWTKQVASHWGGTRNGTIVHWPKGIEGKGEIRNQFAHVIDVAPTILEVAKLPQPKTVNGVTQHPIEGTSFVYSFNDAQAPEQHETQYFEMLGNRAIYHQGWTAAAKHKFPWLGSDHDVDEDVWELYDSSADWTQARDLAAEHPEKVKELERLFIIQAARFNVLPLDDRSAERFNSDIVGRPTLIRGNEQILYAGMTRLGENSVLTMKNKSHAITAEVVVPDGGAEGVIVAQGGAYGGWSFFVKDNTLKYAYNMLGLEVYDAAASSTLPSGKHQVRAEFAYDGGGLGKGGTITFYVDGEATGEGRIKATLPFQFSFDETLDVGLETGSAVSPQYTPATSKFNGTIDWVKLENTGDDHSHLIDPEHLLNVAMLKQ